MVRREERVRDGGKGGEGTGWSEGLPCRALRISDERASGRVGSGVVRQRSQRRLGSGAARELS